MAAFVKGYANERGGWDNQAMVHRKKGQLWNYPIPLGNMQFGVTEACERVAWSGGFEDDVVLRSAALMPLGDIDWRDASDYCIDDFPGSGVRAKSI